LELKKLLKETFITRTEGYLDVSSKRKIWEELASAYSTKLIATYTKDRHLNLFKIIIKNKDYELIIAESDTRPLKIEVSITAPNDDLSFSLSSRTTGDGFLDFLGRKTFKTGNSEFDNQYVIKTNDKSLAKAIFSNNNFLYEFIKIPVFSIDCAFNSKSKKIQILSVINRTTTSYKDYKSLIDIHLKLICQI